MRDETIIQEMRAGDPGGLEALMERYGGYVSSVVWSILRGTMTVQDGEEVASDVFLAAWAQAGELRPDRLRGWLGSVARHKAKNKLRQRGQTLPLEEDALELPGPRDLAEDLEREEERRLVRRGVEALPAQDREIFLRHYYYAQTVGEIAAAMDMKEPTVKTRLRRGRMKLQETLEREGLAGYGA